LYINQKNGTFRESIKEYTRQISYFGMGCDVADINNDGLVDIGVVDMAAEDHCRDKTLMAGMDSEGFKYYFYQLGYQFQYMFNSLQLNNGNNTFSNIAALAGVLKSDWSWSALFTDLKLDGYKDYYVTNGYRRYGRDNDFKIKMAEVRQANGGNVPLDRREELYRMMPEIKLVNKLYINDGNLHFEDNSEVFTHPDLPSFSYGLAVGDFDNDGDYDLVLNNIDQKAFILKNNIRETGNHNFIKITLDHPNAAKKLTSKVYVYTKESVQFQEYYFVRGYESTMEESLLFGLGKMSKIDSIKVIWPDNKVQILREIEVNQTINIEYNPERIFNKPANQLAFFEKQNPAELNINYRHIENAFDDFEEEILLPQKQTAFGPALAVADVNNDGLDDFFAGGGKGQSGLLYLQQGNGSFVPAESQPWEIDAMSEDVDAVFIDPNQDGNMDLLVLSGGSGDFVNEKHFLIDRFYANLGTGRFGKIGNILPDLQSASYSVIAENIDKDPENELLVLGAAKPGNYPLSEKIILYDYFDNKYNDVTEELAVALLEEKGLTRDAVWIDLNNDNAKDLITVGEWQTINVYINKNGKLYKKTSDWGIEDKEGWWRSIDKSDLDNDGDLDFVVGNVGINFKQKAKKDYPLYLNSSDFNENGTLDIVLAKNNNNKIIPARGRQSSSEQMPFTKDKFETYNAFASSSV
ncbi:MAG: VCBS repeat-containing protein, partial [Bacteroidia bacterium]|nr:VCBS repeat-containing protein [Bacteroidia bacterium]